MKFIYSNPQFNLLGIYIHIAFYIQCMNSVKTIWMLIIYRYTEITIIYTEFAGLWNTVQSCLFARRQHTEERMLEHHARSDQSSVLDWEIYK